MYELRIGKEVLSVVFTLQAAWIAARRLAKERNCDINIYRCGDPVLGGLIGAATN